MKKYVALVIEMPPDYADGFLDDFRRDYGDLRIIYTKLSYSKLWITDREPQEVNNGK